MVLIISCDSPVTYPKGDTFAGYILFTDSSFIPNGYYTISLFRDKTFPFDTLPVKTNSLVIKYGEYADFRYGAYYRMNDCRKILCCLYMDTTE
jgi:hypothetical protein